MGIDQLLVDPVAAACRQLVHIQLAGGEHHLADGPADLIAIDVDVGKVVVGANFLNLAQRVLQRVPIPQPDVFERRLVVRRVNRLDPRVSGKRVRLDAVERVRAPRHVDVVRDEGPFSHQLVGLDDEVADVPAHDGDDDVAGEGGNDGRDKPSRTGRRDCADPRHSGTQD